MASQPGPPSGSRTPPRNKGLIAGLIKGNQWLINPKNKAGDFWGGIIGDYSILPSAPLDPSEFVYFGQVFRV